MSANVHTFPTFLITVTRIRSLADELGRSIEAISPNKDMTVPALCSVLYEIAANSDPEFAHRAVRSLRVVASLIEEAAKR